MGLALHGNPEMKVSWASTSYGKPDPFQAYLNLWSHWDQVMFDDYYRRHLETDPED